MRQLDKQDNVETDVINVSVYVDTVVKELYTEVVIDKEPRD